MIEEDTIKILRECYSGAEMGILSINDVLKYVKDEELNEILKNCREGHEDLLEQISELLESYGDGGKEPNSIIKGMSWMKTNMKLAVNESDATIANIITDGCNMGIKSLSKYLNRYTAAEERAKDIAKKLIAEEERLSVQMRDYL